MIKALLRRPRHREDGSALILTLIVITTMGIIVGASLSLAGTGLQTTSQIRDLRNQTNYLQGGVDGAINAIRASSTAGGFKPSGTAFPCPPFTPPAAASTDLGAATHADGSPINYQVTCTPQKLPNNGGNDAIPTFAILTLGQHVATCTSGDASCVGFNDISGNHTLNILGGLFSNGDLTVSGGKNNSLFVEGSAYGVGAVCDSSLIQTSDGLAQCPGYSDTDGLGVDPHYAAAIGDDTASNGFTGLGASSATLDSVDKDPLPSCVGSVATFTPGYYSVIPDEMLSAPGAIGCAGFSGVENFAAGNYYFDFPATDSTWNMNEVIGGSITAGFDPVKGDWSKACDPTQPGVQFEFGGASSVNVPTSGDLALCGPTSAATKAYQDVSLYALSSNNINALTTPPTAKDAKDVLLGASGAPTNTDPSNLYNSPLSNAQTLDGTSSSVSLDSTQQNKKAFVIQSAGLNYPGFNQAAALAGTRILHAAVCVADAPDSNAAVTVNVTLPAQGGKPAVTVPATLSAAQPTTFGACSSSKHLYTIADTDLPKVLPDKPQWREAKQLQVSYSVTEAGGSKGTSTVDGVALDLNYVKPVLEVSAPVNSTNQPQCTKVTTTLDFFCAAYPSGSTGAVTIGGTVYTPSVDVTIETQNKAAVLFSRGVIAYSLTVNDNTSFKQATAVFSIPGGGPSFTREVLFTGLVDGTARLWACVGYVDAVTNPDGTVGVRIPGYRVRVSHWDVLRTADGSSPSCT